MAQYESKNRSKAQQTKGTQDLKSVQLESEKLDAESDSLNPFDAVLESPIGDSSVERHAAILGDVRLSHSANAAQRAQIMSEMQRNHGNAYVQRVMDRVQADSTTDMVQRAKLSKSDYNLKMIAAQSHIAEIFHHLSQRISEITKAYWTGWDAYHKAIEKYEARMALTMSVISSVFSSFLAGAAGPLMKGAFEKCLQPGPLVEGLVDVAKTGVAAGASLPFKSAGKYKPLTSPKMFFPNSNSRINGEAKNWHKMLKSLALKPNYSVDPYELVKSKAKIGGKNPLDLPAISPEKCAEHYEKELWKVWIGKYGKKEVTSGYMAVKTTYKYDVPKEVKKRLKALKVPESEAKKWAGF